MDTKALYRWIAAHIGYYIRSFISLWSQYHTESLQFHWGQTVSVAKFDIHLHAWFNSRLPSISPQNGDIILKLCSYWTHLNTSRCSRKLKARAIEDISIKLQLTSHLNPHFPNANPVRNPLHKSNFHSCFRRSESTPLVIVWNRIRVVFNHEKWT